MANPLLDKDFLKELDQIPLKEIYAEIIALNANGEVLESIEGHVTQGTVNIDGASSVRRTCSLTIVADELNIHEYYWGLHTKFKLALGVKNNINTKYPDIIWFKQGVFTISSFTTSQTTNNYTISIQGKDKMCLLNGELGGMVTSLTHDFGTELVTDIMGYTTKNKLTLKQIITAAVHQFGGEPLYNIIVNDLDEKGLELLEYRGKDPIYVRYREDITEPDDFVFAGATYYKINEDGTTTKVILGEAEDIIYNPLFELERDALKEYSKFYGESETTGVPNTSIIYSIARIEEGMTAGYRLTDLVYSGELILNIGETITSLLDKIVSMLGEYEYFYDIDGRFIFQKKKTYLVNPWNNIQSNVEEMYVNSAAYTSAISYSFEDGTLISSYSNNPNYNNIKNDFSVWGVRKSVNEKEIPIHMRYAIDKKPWLYVSYSGDYYTTKTKEDVLQYLIAESDKSASTYIKKPNPHGLSEDWWDIFDWAEYYKLCTGAYPTEVMKTYLRNGGIQFTADEMYAMFPKGQYTNEYFITHKVYIFDVEADGTLGNTGHGTNCTAHRYKEHFIDVLQARGATAYIYKPDLPVEISNLALNTVKVKGENLDWREIIYQMAKDFNENHLEEDFYVILENNNLGKFPKGRTGYEPYYIDISGFWRDLYDPEYKFSFENIALTENEYYEKPEEYYYSKPKYKQCNSKIPFSSGAVYYSLQYDEEKDAEIMKQASGVDEKAYTSVPEKYYYVKADEPTEMINCIITEPYRLSGKGYYRYDSNNQKYLPITSEVSEQVYINDASNFYYLKAYKYLPCFEVIKYNSNYQYFKENGEKYNAVTSKEYEEAPSNYWLKSYTYIQCYKGLEYFPGRTYYIRNKAYITDENEYSPLKIINKDTYDKDPTKYYLRIQETTPCSELEFNSAEIYYRVFPDEGKILTQEEYELDPFNYYVLDTKTGTYAYAPSIGYKADTKYYTLEFIERSPLNSREFNKNKEQYYTLYSTSYVSANEEFDSNVVYYTSEFNQVKSILTETLFNANKTKYYTLEILDYESCAEKNYDNTAVYYIEGYKKQKGLTAEVFDSNPTDYYRARRDFVSCAGTSYHNKTKYYVKDGTYINCYQAGLTYQEGTDYYEYNSEKSEFVKNDAINADYFTKNIKKIYIYGVAYINCEEKDIPYNAGTTYYTCERKLKENATDITAGAPGKGGGGGGGGGGGKYAWAYTPVNSLTEETYIANRKDYFIVSDTYNLVSINKSEFSADKNRYYTYDTICVPCGEMKQVLTSDIFNPALRYYKKEEEQYIVASVSADNFADLVTNGLYYGAFLEGKKYIVGRTYYTFTAGKYKVVENLSKAQMESDITKYYELSYIPCLEVDAFEDGVDYFKKEYIKVSDINNTSFVLNEEMFNTTKDQYYIVKTTEYRQCTNDSTYVRGKNYYVLDYTPQYDLTETTYNEDRSKYSIIEIDEETGKEKKQFKQCSDYKQCNSNSVYSEEEVYYIKTGEGEYLEERIDEADFKGNELNYYVYEEEYFFTTTVYYIKKNEEYIPKSLLEENEYNRFKSLYYITNDVGELYNCVKAIRDYGSNNEYYTRIETEEINEITQEKEIVIDYIPISLANENEYEERIKLADLYEKFNTFECCVHPLEYSSSINFYIKITNLYNLETHWHRNVSESPELLNFWFDFLDEDSELQKFGCHSIGNRPKGVNDNQVKAIYFRETPTVIFYTSDEVDRSKLGYTYLKLTDNVAPLFDISSQGKSAKTAIDNLVYTHACGAESITISVLPIYHLEPNTRIFVRNDDSGINGEYILVRYNLTLGTNGNMSITASKAVDKLY